MKKILIVLSLFLLSCNNNIEVVHTNENGKVNINGKTCSVYAVQGASMYPLYYIDCGNSTTSVTYSTSGKNNVTSSVTVNNPEPVSSCK